MKIFGKLASVVGGIYFIFLLYPNPLFANNYLYRNFTIYSDRQIPKNIETVIDDTIKRLETSELYKTTDKFKVYLCNESWRFKFFTRNENAGGVVNFLLSPNIFIRESKVETNQLIPPISWKNSMADRPLSYFLTHEAIHSLQRKYDRFLMFKAPAEVIEGYAEYIAKYKTTNINKLIENFKNNSPSMNPENGLYDRYNLYIFILIKHKGYSFKKIIQEKPDLEKTLIESMTLNNV